MQSRFVGKKEKLKGIISRNKKPAVTLPGCVESLLCTCKSGPNRGSFLLSCALMFTFATVLYAGVDVKEKLQTVSTSGLSLEDLMNLEVGVASGGKATPMREAPGILTVVTREEILAWGARDLFDVLQMVPGLQFAADVWGQIGLGVRGNWASEGKMLLLIDGIEMNEREYQTIQFMNHYHVENIQRIEIIRGPGSALYGGSAELAVINIISRSASQVNGISFNASGSVMNGPSFGGAGGGIVSGRQSGDIGTSVETYFGQRVRSLNDYKDIYGSSFNLKKNNDIQSQYVNAGFTWKEFQARLMIDRYRQMQMDGYDAIYDAPIQIRYDSYTLNLQNRFQPSDNLGLKPWVCVTYQQPWYADYVPEAGPYQTPWTRSEYSLKGGLISDWTASKHVNLLLGVEGIYTKASSTIIEEYGDSAYFQFYNGEYTLRQSSISAFTQGVFDLEFIKLTTGARAQYSPDYGWAIVPRAALTKDFGMFHMKLLGSGSYRSPSLENINTSKRIITRGYPIKQLTAEQTWVGEVEAGVQPTKNISIDASMFHIRINDPIVYFYDYIYNNSDTVMIDGYKNFSRTGTQGCEVDLRVKYPIWCTQLSYSYQRAYKNGVDSYRTPGHDNLLVGFAPHKVAGSFTLSLLEKHLNLTASAVWTASRYAYTTVDTEGVSVIDKLDPITILNMNVSYALPLGLTISLTGHNLFDDTMLLAQAYNGYHAPISSSGRSVSFNITYDLKTPQSLR